MFVQQRPSKRPMLTFATACLFATTSFVATPAAAAITIASDPILYWNDIAIRFATAFTPGGAPAQARAYAMVNIAMHDAVNATRGSVHRSYLTGISTPGGDSRAAAAQAAHDVLVALNPSNSAQYATSLSASLALIGDGTAKADGVTTGQAYAAAILSRRAGDGSSVIAPYTSTNLPGDYRLTPGVGAAALPAWGNVQPFVLSSASEVPVGPPPALGSVEYAAAYNEVKAIGSLGSLTRTADQTNSALFWDISNGGTWIRAGLVVAEDEGMDTLGFAGVFATLAVGIADASIAVFDAKYDYRLWRPITAIQLGDIDGNDATVADATWTSLFAAPGHPSYVSGHAGISGVASTILQSYFGDTEAFTFNIGPDSRSFTSLSQAAQDAADSRLWGGIHFRFDNEVGLALGRQVGTNVLRRGVFASVPESSSWAMMIFGFALAGWKLRSRPRHSGRKHNLERADSIRAVL